MYVRNLTAAGLVFVPELLRLLQNLISLVPTVDFIKYPKHAKVHDRQTFDFIIVGAGSAGCVVANRLTEVSDWSVLLIEAGGDPPAASNVPGLLILIDDAATDWGYNTVNDGVTSQAFKKKSLHMTRGKMLGGSSGSNFMFYIRGNKIDYDYWVEQGNVGWDWDNVTAYFKKSERLRDESILKSNSADLHGTEGYLGVSKPRWQKRTVEYFKAFKENGHDILVDTNGYQQLGYSTPTITVDMHIRQSTANSFLSPIRNRKNLYVLKNTLARKVIFKNKKAVGVEVTLPNNNIVRLFARKEVILSSGSINSPQLLMLSGVGPEKHLKDMSIPVILDSPLVGSNLHDHMTILLVLSGPKKLFTVTETLNTINNINKFPFSVMFGQVALNKTQTYSDYQTILFPAPAYSVLPTAACVIVEKLRDDICMSLVEQVTEKEILAGVLTLLQPKSRGKIRLQSKDPMDDPLIYNGFFSDLSDLDNHVKYVQDYITVLNTTYFKSIQSEVIYVHIEECAHLIKGSYEYWKCYVLNTVSSLWHPVGTCAMGPNGVLDERLRVRGVKGLRVVDASIMPKITRGTINAPVIMIAEKAADMIKIDNGINIS